MTETSPSHHLSPLRYPGGKAKLSTALKQTIRSNGLLDRTYIEPFAGGAGVGLALLMHGYVSRIVINDLNPPIFAFWRSILDEPDRFIEAVLSIELSVTEWERQRAIFRDANSSLFSLGFSAFYLNRTNHSGVLNGGVIGGKAQASSYGINARFNREELAQRISRIKRHRDEILICNEDAANLINSTERFGKYDDLLIYADPPYVNKGPDLYYDFFRKEDHVRLSIVIASLPSDIAWFVSYDDHDLVRNLYKKYQSALYSLSYSVKNGRQGTEVIFFSDNIFDLSAFPSKPLTSQKVSIDQVSLR